MMYYFFTFYYFLFAYNSIISLCIISLLLISSSILVHIFRHKFFIVTIREMKIKNKVVACITLFSIILMISSFFLFWRIFNIGRTYDLKILLFNIYMNLSYNKIIYIFIILFFLVAVFICIIQLILLLQKIIFYQILKYHIYIIGYTQNTKETYYEKFIDKINPITYIPFKIERIFLYFLYYTYVFLKRGEYKESFEKFWMMFFSNTYYCYYKKHLSKYLILFSIFYDIIFNDMVINKIYYLLPLTFCYYLKEKFLNVAAFIEQSDCIRIYNISTKTIKIKTHKMILFEDNTDLTLYDIQEIKSFNRKLLRAYNEVNPYKSNFVKQVLLYNKSFLTLTIFILYTIIERDLLIILDICGVLYEINLDILLLGAYGIQIVTWITVQYNKIFKYLYWCFYIVLFCLLVLLFFKHNIVFFYNEVYTKSFITFIDTYTIQEKFYFAQEYLKYKIQSTCNIKDKEYLVNILEKFSFYDFIESEITIMQLSTFIDNLIIIHQNYEDLISFLTAQKNNEIIKEIELQHMQIDLSLKTYLNHIWRIIKDKFI